MRDVVDRSGREVVENQNVMSGFEESFGEMGADEPGPAGD
jgi:hypothetical protein